MARRNGRRLVGGAVAVVFTLGGFAAFRSGEAEHALGADLNAGNAWFHSPVSGEVSLIDGSTAQRIARVKVTGGGARPGAVGVTQARSSAIVVDTTGPAPALVRVDAATWTASPPVVIGLARPEQATVRMGRDVAWLVSPEGAQAELIEPRTLSPLSGQLTLPPETTIDGIAVTPDDDLWTVSRTGEVRSFRAGQPDARTQLDGADDAVLTLADGDPVAVDVGRRKGWVLDPESGRVRRTLDLGDLPAGALLARAAGDRPWLLAVDPGSDRLLVVHTDEDRSRSVNLVPPAADPGCARTYGEPVERAGLVFVPCYGEAGRAVLVVDPDKPPGAQVRVSELGIGRFDLAVTGDRVWFDERAGDTAGFLTDDLAVHMVAKSGDSAPTEGPRRPPPVTPPATEAPPIAVPDPEAAPEQPPPDAPPPDLPPPPPAVPPAGAPPRPATPGPAANPLGPPPPAGPGVTLPPVLVAPLEPVAPPPTEPPPTEPPPTELPPTEPAPTEPPPPPPPPPPQAGFRLSAATVEVGKEVTVRNTSENFDSVQWMVDGRAVDKPAAGFQIAFDQPGPHSIGLTVSKGGISDSAPKQAIVVSAPKPPEFPTKISADAVSRDHTLPEICQRAGIDNAVAAQRDPAMVRELKDKNQVACLAEGADVTLVCKKTGDALYDNAGKPEDLWYKDKGTGGYVNALWVNRNDDLDLPAC